MSEDVWQQARAIVEKRVQEARENVAACRKWSPAQAEWSRARDLGLFILDDFEDALRALHNKETAK